MYLGAHVRDIMGAKNLQGIVKVALKVRIPTSILDLIPR